MKEQDSVDKSWKAWNNTGASPVVGNLLKKVKLGKLVRENPESRLYWNRRGQLKKLTRSLEEEGYNPEKYGYIQVYQKDSVYVIRDGQHRTKLLNDLYGEDYEITVELVINNPEDGGIDANDGFLTTMRKGIKTLPIIYLPSMIFFLIYLFLPVLLFSLFCYVFMMFTKDNGWKYYHDTHPKKGFVWIYKKSKFLYEMVMTVYYNARNGVLLIAFLGYLYYILSSNWYEILIITAISFSIMAIFKVLNIPQTIDIPALIKKIRGR